MIKKLSRIFIVLILISIPNVALADGWSADNNHILSIEKFNVSGSKITIEGYSFVSHQDNYAAVSPANDVNNITGVKSNLETYLVVYTGNWQDKYVDKNMCNSSANCYSILTTPQVRDLYYARCTDEGCTDDDKAAVIAERQKNGLRDDYTCDDDFTWNGTKVDSECLYRNVGFKVTLDLINIIDELNNSSNIKMRIVSINTNLKAAGKSYTEYARHSGFNIHSTLCKINGSTTCSGNKVRTGDYEFTFSNFADEAYFDAEFALAFDMQNNVVSRLSSTYFRSKQIYKILQFRPRQTMTKSYQNVVVGTYEDSLFQLDSEKITCVQSNGSDTCYRYWDDVDGRHYYGNITEPESNTNSTEVDVDYWTVSNFLVLQGELQINSFKPLVTPISCADVWGTNTVTSNTVNCNNSGNYNECAKVSNISSSDAVVYVRHTDQTSACTGGNYSKYKEKIGNTYYLKVPVSADILFNQSATFAFGQISPGVVYAGKGFSLGTTSYSNIITWVNANKNSSGKPYYRYDVKNYISQNGGCVLDETFDINNVTNYYIKSNGSLVSYTNLSDAAFAVIDREAKAYILEDNVKQIKFVSCDSNGNASSNCATKSVSGGWTKDTSKSSNLSFKFNGTNFGTNVSGTRFGTQITNVYNYSLADSYVMVAGDESGKALYGDEADGLIDKLVATGNKFYIDFKWVYSADWPFNLANNINPSLINPESSSWKWNLTGTCSVKVEDGYYKEASGGGGGTDLKFTYKYRSISLENPFPKQYLKSDGTYGIADNWNDWWNIANNQVRLHNTYNNGVKYKVSIGKFANGATETYAISDVNSYGGNYISMVGFNKDGTSDFIKKYFSIIQDGGSLSYCGLGYFSATCDKYS